MKKTIKFVDLFCGIGGFHSAIENGECVLACDIDEDAMNVYEKNYKVTPFNDITKLDEKNIPTHNLLCAGFPCQSFSKAGKQNGFSETRGTLFFEIERILRHHKTKYILLENVRNLVSHDDGNTWKVITKTLKDIGYRLTAEPLVLSPNDLGTPHLRPRVFIVGKYEPDNVDTPLTISIPKKKSISIYSLLDKSVDPVYNISKYEDKVLTIWDDFYKGLNEKTIGFPIWADFFKCTDDLTVLPAWKRTFIEKNMTLYKNNKSFIDSWLTKNNNLDMLSPSHRKMEWQASTKISSVFEGIIQFRPSGVRIKAPSSFPALVAMVQIPIIGKFKRRLTPRECARLQDFPDTFVMDSNDKQAYKQFGNGVNVKVVKAVIDELLKQ
jgi:DNA (cytosine-5)-methyltransferase 1